MVVSQVIGVGIFLTPATLMRTVGGIGPALGVWAVLGLLSLAGALCYAELTTRFPRAGGGYVFLREAFGARVAFVFGWMALLVTDPGITAALGIGLSQYLLAAAGGSPSHTAPVATAVVASFCLLTLGGIRASGAFLRWAAAVKLAIVAVLVMAGLARAGDVDALAASVSSGTSGLGAYAPAVIAAFFAFGGWWELGRMSEEVESPRRTMPRALVGGLALVTVLYALITVAFTLSAGAPGALTDDAFVAAVGAALFGDAAARLLAGMVVAAVAGSLAATFLAAPRMYMAMSRDGLFPVRVLRFDQSRGTAVGATLIQTALACVLIALGTFEQVLGYFVPVTIFFLGLSAAAVLRLPRPDDDGRVFVAPWHPVPVLLFLFLIAAVLVLFAVGQPRETLIGVAVAAIGVPVSYLFSITDGTKDTTGTTGTTGKNDAMAPKNPVGPGG
jgi:basic amino acid/polyamine antiporter, APA family